MVIMISGNIKLSMFRYKKGSQKGMEDNVDCDTDLTV